MVCWRSVTAEITLAKPRPSLRVGPWSLLGGAWISAWIVATAQTVSRREQRRDFITWCFVLGRFTIRTQQEVVSDRSFCGRPARKSRCQTDPDAHKQSAPPLLKYFALEIVAKAFSDDADAVDTAGNARLKEAENKLLLGSLSKPPFLFLGHLAGRSMLEEHTLSRLCPHSLPPPPPFTRSFRRLSTKAVSLPPLPER